MRVAARWTQTQTTAFLGAGSPQLEVSPATAAIAVNMWCAVLTEWLRTVANTIALPAAPADKIAFKQRWGSAIPSLPAPQPDRVSPLPALCCSLDWPRTGPRLLQHTRWPLCGGGSFNPRLVVKRIAALTGRLAGRLEDARYYLTVPPLAIRLSRSGGLATSGSVCVTSAIQVIAVSRRVSLLICRGHAGQAINRQKGISLHRIIPSLSSLEFRRTEV